jgi:hypothetical protein
LNTHPEKLTGLSARAGRGNPSASTAEAPSAPAFLRNVRRLMGVMVILL